MLFPGTFGSSCWYTRVTFASFAFGASARTLPNGRVATSSEQRMRFTESFPSVGGRKIMLLPVADPFVETDAAEVRLAQRQERTLLDSAAPVSVKPASSSSGGRVSAVAGVTLGE